ncbi:MAG: creatininase family protein [Treponema sp.]|nr:creatininase family protein [Treponema sp.]
MTRIEVEDRIKEYPVAILPVGSCEQHGPHLPLGVDTMLAQALTGRISDMTGALVFPPLNFGYSWVWRNIPGTISFPVERMIGILKDAAASVDRYGIRLLVFINGHEANGAAVKYAIREIQERVRVKLLGMFYPGLKEIYGASMESPAWEDGLFHADEFETSLMLAVHPELVNMKLAVREYPVRPELFGMDNTMLGAISASGVFGDATRATKEKGGQMLSSFAKNAVSSIEAAFNGLR